MLPTDHPHGTTSPTPATPSQPPLKGVATSAADAGNNAADAPIGVFDSGLGGLSVVNALRQKLPAENLLLLADSAHAPYGDRPEAWIQRRSEQLVQQLIAQGCKAIVIACNTATAAAATELRERYKLPIIAMEPAVKPAAEASQNGRIGVLATTGTLASARFAGLLGRFASDIEVITQPCPGLVEAIENASADDEGLQQRLRSYVTPLLEQGVDTIVLGCTHYPLVRDQIAAIAGKEVTVIDTGAAVARQLHRRLEQQSLLRATPDQHQPDSYSGYATGWLKIASNGDLDALGRVMARLPLSYEISDLTLPTAES